MGVITTATITYNQKSYTCQIEVIAPEGCKVWTTAETFSTAKSYEIEIKSITPNDMNLNLRCYTTSSSAKTVKRDAKPPFSAVVNSNKISIALTGTSATRILYIHQNPKLSTPTGLYADNITSDSARIGWNAVENATDYKVEYRRQGDTTWNE